MDNQLMPAMMGAVILFFLLGQVSPEGIAKGVVGLKLYLALGGATLVLLYGFAMHLYALGYPESPFNRHSSPLFMSLVCGGMPGLAAWRFYTIENQAGMWVYGGLCGLVLITSVVISFIRSGGPAE